MPGIFGFAAAKSGDLEADLQRMLSRMKHYSWYSDDTYVDGAAGVGLGRVSLGFVDQAAQPARSADGNLLAVLAGEIYDDEKLRQQLAATGYPFQSKSQAEILLAGYLQHGQQFLSSLEGNFVAAIWNHTERKLHLTTDRFGMKPIYYAKAGSRFLFASELKALLVDRSLGRSMNVRGLAQFFTYGYFFNNDTFLENVSVLPAAGWLTFDADTGKITVARYTTFAAKAASNGGRKDWLEKIDVAFKRAVDLRTDNTRNLGLSLSGGLDARTILAVMDRQRNPVTSICMGMEGSMDHASSKRMAELAGNPHHPYYLDYAFLSRFEDHMRWMVHLTDGHYLCQVIVMPTLPLYRELGIEVLLRGHAGELFHMHKAYAYSMDAEGQAIHDDATLESWLFKHLQAYMLEDLDRPLFLPKYDRDFRSLARESMTEALKDAADVEPPIHRVWQMFINQRLRRETALSMVEFNSLVETRLPYLDNSLIDLVFQSPPDLKLGESIQTHILRKRFPEFLAVTNVNTGTRVGASALARKISTFRMRAFAKLGVKGYQPYERLGLWLRRELAPMVKKILLSDQCLGRGVFDPRAVEAVIDGHFSARKNHTFLMMAMMIFELGQREFIDESPADVATVQELARS